MNRRLIYDFNPTTTDMEKLSPPTGRRFAACPAAGQLALEGGR